MAKEARREISVVTIFDGQKDGRQAFVELILHKRYTTPKKSEIDAMPSEKYNQSKVFSDVRVD